MRIQTTRFGPIDVDREDVIQFSEGLIGLASCREWVLLSDTANDAVAWLQCVDRPDIAVAVVAPRRFVPDYQVRVARRELEPLALDRVGSAQVLVIVSKTDDTMTLNLKAPLAINLSRRLGRQLVTNGQMPVQYALSVPQATYRKTA